MSSTPEGIAITLHELGLVEDHARQVIQGIQQGRGAASRRLVLLERAFHLYESYFHLLATTTFDSYRLEELVEELLSGAWVNEITVELRHSRKTNPPTYRRDPKTYTDWLFEDEPSLDLAAPPHTLPRVAVDFLVEIMAVEDFAQKVQRGILEGDPIAAMRVEKLEQVMYLMPWSIKDLRSPSFRFAYFENVLKKLSNNAYCFGLRKALSQRPYPNPLVD